MIDWRTLDEGPELDKLVAQALGYRVHSLNDNPWGVIVKGPSYFAWQGPITSEAMWRDLFKLPLKTHFDAESPWQDPGFRFSADLEDAIWLLDGYPDWTLEYNTDYGIDRRTGYSVSIEGANLCEFAPAPCLAICRAFLALQELESKEQS